MKSLIVAAFAALCLASPVVAGECATLVGLAEYLQGNEKGAAIIEVVPVRSAAIDFLVIYRAENGNVQMIAEFNGCLVGRPLVIDGPRQDVGA